MLFVGYYSVNSDKLETAMAKRLEWDEVKPEGFRMVCDYVVLGKSAPFEGVMVVETANAEDLNTLILYYGDTVKIDIRPASDVLSAIRIFPPPSARKPVAIFPASAEAPVGRLRRKNGEGDGTEPELYAGSARRKWGAPVYRARTPPLTRAAKG